MWSEVFYLFRLKWATDLKMSFYFNILSLNFSSILTIHFKILDEQKFFVVNHNKKNIHFIILLFIFSDVFRLFLFRTIIYVNAWMILSTDFHYFQKKKIKIKTQISPIIFTFTLYYRIFQWFSLIQNFKMPFV